MSFGWSSRKDLLIFEIWIRVAGVSLMQMLRFGRAVWDVWVVDNAAATEYEDTAYLLQQKIMETKVKDIHLLLVDRSFINEVP